MKAFPPGTTVTITGSSWRGRTGTVVALDPKWPDYRLENLRAVKRAGQMGLFGGAA